MNIINQERRLILTYTESFVIIWLYLAELWVFVYFPKLHAHFQALCVHAGMCTPIDIINQLRRHTLTYPESFVKTLLNLGEIWGFVYCPKLYTRFHMLCMPMDIINQLERPTLTYAKSFLKILLNLAEIRWFVYCPKLCVCFHGLCVHACICTPMNIINQHFWYDPTSFGLAMRVCLLAQVACTFSHTVRACTHVHAHG